MRNANRTMALEAAVGLLERCTDWNPRDALVNLPNCYFNVGLIWLFVWALMWCR